jgi:two-component system chemotaxis response regulator CheY
MLRLRSISSQKRVEGTTRGLFPAESSEKSSFLLSFSAGCPEMKNARRLRILCADNNAVVSKELGNALSETGCRVVCASNGGVALRKLTSPSANFDLLITEFELPQLTGLELVREVRARRFAGHIIVLSHSLPREVAAAFRALRVDCLARKPITPDNLVRLVSSVWIG